MKSPKDFFALFHIDTCKLKRKNGSPACPGKRFKCGKHHWKCMKNAGMPLDPTVCIFIGKCAPKKNRAADA
ncbi:MAG: hypothetical protein KGI50_06410 [Patescibacteria group bacterium]|nr:hypothetical protein [Patescibacteria group bacterium]